MMLSVRALSLLAQGYDVITRELLARGAAPNLIDKVPAGRRAIGSARTRAYQKLLKQIQPALALKSWKMIKSLYKLLCYTQA